MSRAYLASRARFGMKFGLDTMRALVDALDHPERRFPSLLVAGTNGKGSVVAYADAVLRSSGLRVGRYTSPHLVRINERIVVNGRAIGDDAFETAVQRVRETATALIKQGTLSRHPTHFEVLTTAAFVHFRRARVEVAVLEVGLGGRLDATNVADPVASAVVSIDRDHEAYLGSTLDAIAREKAGVLRHGRATVLGPMGHEARAAIESVAQSVGARLLDAAEGVEVRPRGGELDVRTPRRSYAALRPLPGRHQQDNLVVALRLLEAAEDAGVSIDPSRLPAAVAGTRWPGRLHWIPGRPPLLLDGAHNPAAARALAEHLRPLGPFVLVFGAMVDKHVAEMAEILFPLARAVVLTRPPLPRAASPEEIAARAGVVAAGAHHRPRMRSALALARRLAPPGAPVVVAGSLYLVGEVLKILGDRRK